MGQLKTETINGVKWQFLQKLTLQPVQVLFSMVLARLISPAEMGVLGLTAIFFAVAGQLASAGFGSALIRKVDRTDEDINTMFWFNAGMSLLMALILMAASPWIAEFYNIPDLMPLTCVSAGMMFLNTLGSVHWTLYTCRRDFKTPAIIHTVVAIISMPVCLVLAFHGWSYWAVVAQGVVSGLLNLIVVWCVSPWKPRFVFSRRSFCELFGFGSKLAASGLLYVLYGNLRTFIVGKFYSPADLGLYTRGTHTATMLPQTVRGVLDSVSYPVLATVQDDDARLINAYRKYISVSTLVLAWVSLTTCALATPLVSVMYGEAWLGCVPFLQLVCISSSVDHVGGINLNLLKVKGRSDLFLRLEIIKRTISVGLLLYAATISPLAICIAGCIYVQMAIFINCYYTGKLLNLTWWKQQKDYMPYVGIAICCNLPALGLAQLPVGAWFPTGDTAATALHYGALLLVLAVGGGLSALLYFGVLTLRRDSALHELLITLNNNPKLGKLSLIRKWSAYVAAQPNG